ncbi:D-Ala-D-Ala carboxypeptidase family metallohydrolase [Vibrio sp. ER1A]|uniref:D-Ala-D-Ala carboxypeptidase family metallohydrolase n=1 Tax=Vibrio sp. ER1A TaxID=1517681 RepID=UPI0004DCF9C9|nr:D-Ala-D-Ala carboxypeptidase family metallohydrolase [Vibrio sp. ER1A]KFA99388.1 hypothetical protein HW45_04125 [Vibrio sp. ER1A]
MYIPKHFKPQEFVSPSIYSKRGVKSLELMDERILRTIDDLRVNLGKPITVNNWLWNGQRKQSGYRDQSFYSTDSEYASSLSQHKYGRALDFLVKGMSAPDVRRHILENKHLYPYITFIEVDIEWCHIDCRNGELRCWSPSKGFVSEERVLKDNL